MATEKEYMRIYNISAPEISVIPEELRLVSDEKYMKIPVLDMIGGVMRWIEWGIPPGGFLQAIIDNDLKEAYRNADSINEFLVKEWVSWFYNYAPGPCWGSPQNCQNWRIHRRPALETALNEAGIAFPIDQSHSEA